MIKPLELENHSEGIPALPEGVTLQVLENGLTIIAREDHSAPVVSVQAWCRSGSIHEGRWLGAGLSHVLEHMLFKGTTRRGPGKIDQEVQDVGGSMNAYTSFDRTVYFINVPNTGAETAIDILCDIMQNATLPEEELAREMDVIRREMDMGQDDPGRRSGRRLFETAYTQSPYRYTIIGYPDVFNEISREDIYHYYREKYAPNNVFFVVVGDIQPDKVFSQIQEAYKNAKSKPLPPDVLPVEPRQTAPRELIEEAPVQLGYLHCSWHIPDLRHPDVPVLDVLSTILGSGRSSRLFQVIREQEGLVHAIDAWTYNPGNPGLFGASAIMDAEKFEPACDAVLAEMKRVHEEHVTDLEVKKAIKQTLASIVSSKKTMQGQAQDLGSSWIAAHDLNFSARFLAAIENVTPSRLQEVARKYLVPENRTLYALLPPRPAKAHAAHVERLINRPVERFTTENGLRVLVKKDARLPLVEIRTVFLGGVLAENRENNGLTHLTARMLLQGTQNRRADQIVTEIESLGGSLDSYGGSNSFGVNAETLAEDLKTGMDLVADVLLHPAFPPDALERERTNQLAAIRAQKDHLLSSAFRKFKEQLFGDAGYGLDPIGNESSVQQLQATDLAAFQKSRIAPNHAVFAVFGDVEPGQVQDLIHERFARWERKNITPPSGLTESQERASRTFELREKKQAVLVMGFPGTTLDNPDRYALELLKEACSDLGSRLFVRIREKLGLAYFVGAQHVPGLVPGFFAFYVGTAPDKARQVEEELIQETELLRTEPFPQDELDRAKAKIIGHKKIADQDIGHQAMSCALDELYGLGFDYFEKEPERYQAVTAERVLDAAQRYLVPDRMVIVEAGPEEFARNL